MMKQVEEAVPPRRQALSQEGAWHVGGNAVPNGWKEESKRGTDGE